MTSSPLPPLPGEEAPIDAEFEPAEEKSAKSRARIGGPGWLAYGVLLLIALASFALAAFGSGLIPGFAPGSEVSPLTDAHVTAHGAGGQPAG